MVLKLNKLDYNFLEENMELSAQCINLICNRTASNIEFEVDNFSEFIDMMNFDIVNDGMSNQNTVNEKGKRMYSIYDAILSQKT